MIMIFPDSTHLLFAYHCYDIGVNSQCQIYLKSVLKSAPCGLGCCSFKGGSSIAIILMGKRELVALLNLSSRCLVMVERLFLAVPQGCLQFVIVVFPDHTH